MISVITVSNRPALLLRCATQVMNQIATQRLEHILVLDKVDLSHDLLEDLRQVPTIAKIVNGAGKSPYVWERMSALRNQGIRASSSEYIAFLDDDNLWEVNHLASLYGILQADADCGATHSWRTLWNRDGTAHIVKDLYPWVLGGDKERQRALFRIQSEAGILTSGSNLVRDRYGFTYCDQRFSCVDTGEWLLRRRLWERFPFREEFSYTEILYGFCDDYLYGLELLRHNVTVQPTGETTLRYYLGGNSQSSEGGPDEHTRQP